jgi:hypothetical protein
MDRAGGTVLPSFGSHHPFPPRSIRRGQPGMVLSVREGLGAGRLDLLTGLAESFRGRSETWTERAL